MRSLLCCVSTVALAVAALAPIGAQAPKLQLTLHDGRVTLIAQDVSIRDVLQAWSRIGDTRIVNAEKMPGTRVTLQLTDATEAAALDILLRSAAGYIAAPRSGERAGSSMYDRIIILASSVAPAAPAPTAAPAFAAPQPVVAAEPDPAPIPEYSAPPPVVEAHDDPAPASAAAGSAPMTPTRPTARYTTPFAGVAPQIEGAQPRASAWAELMKNQPQKPAGGPGPETVSRPGIVTGTPGLNGRGGGH